MSRKKKDHDNLLKEAALSVEMLGSKKLISQEEDSIDALTATTSLEELNETTEFDEHREEEQTKDIEVVNELTDDKFEKELRKFIIPKLRSASYRWKFRSEAIKKARVSRGNYRCAMCGKDDLKNGEFAVDHVEPVVALTGWDGDLDTYIRRMFVKTEGWQILCKDPCHTIKTDTETQIRKLHRSKKK